MALGTEGSSTAVEERGPSLAEEVGGMMGDYFTGESPEPEDPNSGAPPADDPAASESAPDEGLPDGSEGLTPDAEHAGDPPAVAADASPDEDDPLKDAQPLTYVVDGETRTVEGIRTLGEHGAIVDRDFLPKLQQRLSERDHLYEQGQRSHQRYTDLERLTKWDTRGENGETRTLTGRDGLEAQRLFAAEQAAKVVTYETRLDAAMSDPEQFATLYDVVQDANGNYAIVPNAKGFADIKREAALSAREWTHTARQHFQKLGAPAPADAAPEAPVSDLAPQTVEATITANQITGLNAEDKTFLAEQLDRYVRPTTPQEKAAGLGSRIVDAKFVDLVKRTAQIRTANTATVTAATSVAAENARKMAAALRPKPSTTPTRAPNTPVAPQHTRTQDASDAWDMAERASAAAIRSRVR